MSPESILIIDDQRDNIEFLVQRVLEPGGYAVSLARDGETGLYKALQETPDLIIMNMTVPRLNGLQVLQELRQAKSDIPVILMTFHGSEEAAVRAFQLGAQGYIIKPYRAEEMRQAVERNLRERRLLHERDRLANSVAHVNRQMERRLKELSVLSGIGKSVTALLDEDRLLTRVVEAAVYITGAEEGFLLLVDEESGELYMRAARGLGEKYAREFRIKVNDSLAGQVVQTGKPVIIHSSHQDDRFKVKTGYLVRSLLHVPLKAGDVVIGVLSVDHMLEARTFTNHDLFLLSTLADYTAIALEHSHLRTQLQEELEKRHVAAPVPTALPPGVDQVQARDELASFLIDVETHREEAQSRIEAGKTILSGLQEQVASLGIWLDGVASQEESLATQGVRVDPAVAVLPAVFGQDLGTILDSIADGVLAVDHDDQVVLANRAAEVVLGNGLIGREAEEVCEDPRWSKTYRIVKAAAQLSKDAPGGEITGATTPLLVDQRMFRASFRVRPSADHGPSGIVVVLRDVTAEREAQRAKDSFIASVSQELRTPMTSIVGYTELLLGRSVGPLGETQIKFLDRIRNNAERMGALLNDLVGMSVIDSRQLEFHSETMDLAETIHDAVDSLRAQLAARSQVIDVDIEPDLPYVQAGPEATYHILTNLVQNAHRCSRERARIALRASQVRESQAPYVMVSVTDVGGGIAPKDYKKVFNRFYRADDPVVPGLGDPGVTLPIVKILVEAQGGRMWLDSVSGVGSTFTFILPVHPAAQSAGRTVRAT